MDAVQEWRDSQARVIGLTETLSEEQAQTVVPSCPAWTVHDLLAHVIGVDADVLSGDEADDHNPEWTQAHVDGRQGRTIAELNTEWRALTEPLAAWMATNGTRPLGDITIHEQDLRAALGEPGARDTDAMVAMRDRMADGLDAAVRDAGAEAIELRCESWTFVAGDGEPTVQLTASQFDLTRALMSRRSADELRSWTTRGELGDRVALFATLGPLPDTAPPE